MPSTLKQVRQQKIYVLTEGELRPGYQKISMSYWRIPLLYSCPDMVQLEQL